MTELARISKSGLTSEIKERVYKLVREGNYPRVACRACGIQAYNLRKWAEWANEEITKEGGGYFSDFFEMIERAEAEAQVHYLSKIAEAGDKGDAKNWPAFAWILERRHPEKYGQVGKRGPNLEDAPRTLEVYCEGELIEEQQLRPRKMTSLPVVSGLILPETLKEGSFIMSGVEEKIDVDKG